MSKEAARTAFVPILVVAVEQHERRPLVDDKFAGQMLPPIARVAANWKPSRKLLKALCEKQLPGVYAHMLCRKRYMDDAATKAEGAEAVVLLGAGMDTLAYRLPVLAKTKVYEVDQPINVERKRAALVRVFGAAPEHVALVPVDFDAPAPGPGAEQPLGRALAKAGWRTDQKTLFVWEGVTQYLTREGVEQTLRFLATAAPGSLVALSYMIGDFMAGRDFFGAERLHRRAVVKQRLWKVGFEPDEIAELLASHGWRVVDDVGVAEYAKRYVEPSGRGLSPAGLRLERFSTAVKN